MVDPKIPEENDSKEALRESEKAVRQAKASRETTEILVDEVNRSVRGIQQITSANGYVNRFRSLLGGASR